LDAQGFVRVAEGNDVVFKDWEEKREGLAMVEFLKVDDTEAQVLTGTTDRREAAATLAAFGPKEVVLTHGKGVLVYSKGRFHEASFAPQNIVGRTGRGDTCFAVYVARRLSTEPQEAVRFAAAATSLKMETPGPLRDSVDRVQAMLGEA
jgi:sugar/nucleoside kinase (ribokinase family)